MAEMINLTSNLEEKSHAHFALVQNNSPARLGGNTGTLAVVISSNGF